VFFTDHWIKILDEHFKKLNDMIAEAVLSQKKSLPS